VTGAGSGRGSVRGWIADGATLAARIALSATFLYACWFKIADPYEFAINIATYQILPDSLVNVLALTLPWLELGAGLLVLAGALSRESALAIAGMLIMFLAAILIAMSKDLSISCGCFASEAAQADIGWPKVIEDAAMLAGAAWIVALGGGRMSVDALVARRRSRRQADGIEQAR